MSAILVLSLVLIVRLAGVSWAEPMGTAWTYQGRLLDKGRPANETYDLQCMLFDAKTEGVQVGDTLLLEDGTPTDGYFTVYLDFGVEVFDGQARYLEMAIRPWDSNLPEDFVVISPRIELTANPYSLQTRGIYVDNDLRVGIGTTSPQHKLDVVNITGTAVSGYTRTGKAVSGWSEGTGIGVYGESGEEDGFAGYFYGGRSYFSGNVGIGTTTPEYNLHVKSSGVTNGIAVTSSAGKKMFWVREGTDASCGVFLYNAAGSATVQLISDGESTFNGGNINVSDRRIKNYKGFPMPDYDSGWVPMPSMEGWGIGSVMLTHNVGGSTVDNYVVDFQVRDEDLGINNLNIGWDPGSDYGVSYESLTTSTITVLRNRWDYMGDYVRVRIWKY